jgi:hypothetical protein
VYNLGQSKNCVFYVIIKVSSDGTISSPLFISCHHVVREGGFYEEKFPVISVTLKKGN